MFRNYFKTAIRTILRNRVYSGINILGLTIGLSACMIVATVVIDDLSYDRQWKNSSQLYRIVTVNKMGEGLYDRFASSFTGLSTSLKTGYPEVKAVARLIRTVSGSARWTRMGWKFRSWTPTPRFGKCST